MLAMPALEWRIAAEFHLFFVVIQLTYRLMRLSGRSAQPDVLFDFRLWISECLFVRYNANLREKTRAYTEGLSIFRTKLARL
jgi:hypothetical protein